MKKFFSDKPVLFGLAVFALGMVLAVIFMLPGTVLYLPQDFSVSIGRLLASAVIWFIFRRYFKDIHPFSGLLMGMPLLLFAAWNLGHKLSHGMSMTLDYFSAFVNALAPAVFEEFIFRVIEIGKLRECSKTPMYALLASSLLFSLIHITNIISGQIAATLIQLLYSFSIGMILGAVYLKTNDLCSIILYHFLIDLSSQIFTETPQTTSILFLVLVGVLVIMGPLYGIWLISKDKQ